MQHAQSHRLATFPKSVCSCKQLQVCNELTLPIVKMKLSSIHTLMGSKKQQYTFKPCAFTCVSTKYYDVQLHI